MVFFGGFFAKLNFSRGFLYSSPEGTAKLRWAGDILTSTFLTSHNFDRGSQIFKKNLETSRLKKDILSQKLLSLKNIWKSPKN
jgi:hypothetical protein